ncbi:MAG: dodecin family protein [Steroidobacteraceae bacterium]
MTIAKVIEISESSKKGFDDAVRKAVELSSDTVDMTAVAWMKDQSVLISAGKVVEYRVTLKITYVL